MCSDLDSLCCHINSILSSWRLAIWGADGQWWPADAEDHGVALVAASLLLLLWRHQLLLELWCLFLRYFSSMLFGWLGWYSGNRWLRRDFPTPPPSTFGGRPSLPCQLLARTWPVMVAVASPTRSEFAQGPDCVSAVSSGAAWLIVLAVWPCVAFFPFLNTCLVCQKKNMCLVKKFP